MQDTLAEGDKVVVCNLWAGTRADTGQRIAFHGFALCRIAGGKIVERWAMVTLMHELAAQVLSW